MALSVFPNQNNQTQNGDIEDSPRRKNELNDVLVGMAAAAGGVILGGLIPWLLPGIVASIIGPEPKAYWDLSRASALVSFGLLWLSMLFGIGISNKLARVWPGGPSAYDLHQYTGLLGLGFGLFHALILLGDHYIGYSFAQIAVPFNSTDYRLVAVALGQIAFYVLIPVTFTFYIRKRIGIRAWHLVHFAGYAAFALALLHGLLSGTDSPEPWAQALYWLAGTTALFLTAYRLFTTKPRTTKPIASR